MEGIGQITNTRTIDVALGDMIERLERAPRTAEVRKLLAEARRFHEILVGWAIKPVASGEQFDVVAKIMQFLGKAMQATEGLGEAVDDPDVTPPPRPAPASRDVRPANVSARPSDRPPPEGGELQPVGRVSLAGRARVHGPAAPSGAATKESAPDGSSGFSGSSPGGSSRAVDRGEGGQVARAGGAGIKLVRSYMRAWQPAADVPGVRLKVMFEDAQSGCRHAMVRLENGAELPGHHHLTAENAYVLDGCVLHGEAAVHAGECICIDAGANSGALRSRGESTMLLIGSDRPILRG